jgi:phenylalanyl-tRNA synthetase alpha chain
LQEITTEKWLLTEEGKTYAANGSPEMRLFMAIPQEGITKEELQVMIATHGLFLLSIRVL